MAATTAATTAGTTAGTTLLSRRETVLGAGGAVLLTLLGAACGAAPESTPAETRSKQPVRLTYLLHNSAKKQVDEGKLPEYRATNPHVDVDFSLVPDAELTGKITSLFASGSGPEIFNPFNGPSAAFIERGLAAEVDYKAVGLGSAQKLVDAYAWPSALDGWKAKGKFYGLPTEVSNYCLYVNNRLFRKAGLDPEKDYPRDWDQMVQVAQKLTRREGSEIVQRGFEPDYGRPHFHWGGHAYQLAGPFLADDGKVSINSEAAARTLQWWADWGQRHQLGSPKLPLPGNTFYEESLAMWASGSWYAPGIKTRNGDLYADFSVRPFPRWRDKRFDHGTHVYGYAMMVSAAASADVRAEAWRLAWFFSSYPIEHLKANGLLQPKRDFVESAAFKDFKDIPYLAVFLEDMKKSTYFPRTLAFDPVSAALKEYFAKVWTEGQPAKQVLPDLQKELERVVAQARTA